MSRLLVLSFLFFSIFALTFWQAAAAPVPFSSGEGESVLSFPTRKSESAVLSRFQGLSNDEEKRVRREIHRIFEERRNVMASVLAE
ncbi:uncharacterized protein VTP21DRAFT_7595 [Calcarisporiella thermophila]|uniref:uncharacterized protein n=1 Tax=Calcarisporiella thermophila TaxID=911321 RepID=UPI003742B4D6